ncbi:MAG: tetratricopeptide repeat protein [Burkholderiales bacterium]|nr:tetratricopeptide repeat protein [Burkholderiales bacterium]
MALDLEEQEKLDELKAWWKQNAKWVIGGVTAFVLAVAGWRGWQYWTHKQASEASLLFDRAVQAAMLNDAKAVKETTGQIMEHYPRSGYATPAAWLAGRLNHDAGDLKSALAQYEYALEHARDDSTKALARLRLAAVYLDNKQPDKALALLAEPPAAAYAGLYANLKGDILYTQGKTSEARAAYQEALKQLDADSVLRPIVEIKLDALGG